MSSLESIFTDIIVDLIIVILPIAIIWVIWKYVFKIKLSEENQEPPEFKKNKIELTGKKQENKPELYWNIFLIIALFFSYFFFGIFFIGATIYFIIVFVELLIFSKFKNENVTWTQITKFIAASLVAGMIIIFFIAASIF